jgi:CDP-glycerol glycerophosphotransferase (TagB/SpsB family)
VWQAFGDWDRRYRVEHSGLAADNVVALGSPYSDLLRPESELSRGFRRESVSADYRVDVAHKQTILFAPTWHHGGPLEHWGDEPTLLGRLFQRASERDANVLLRLHDKHRYEASYVAALEQLCTRYPNVQVKWKDEAPDSLVDLLVSDVMISNYSSLLNAWYYTQKPSLHVDPRSAGAQYYRRMKRGRLRKERIEDADAQWKLDLDQLGGLCAHDFDELLAQLDVALDDPACCVAAARSFCARYVTEVDGRSCERVAAVLRRLCAAPAGERWI